MLDTLVQVSGFISAGESGTSRSARETGQKREGGAANKERKKERERERERNRAVEKQRKTGKRKEGKKERKNKGIKRGLLTPLLTVLLSRGQAVVDPMVNLG